MKQKDLDKAKEQVTSNSSNMEKKLDQSEINADEIIDISSKMRVSHADVTNQYKKQGQQLQEKLSKTKKEVILTIEEDYKTEYLAKVVETSSQEAQCDIWEKPDYKSMLNEKAEQKNKKKPKSVSS